MSVRSYICIENDNKTYTFVELIEILKQEISKLNAVLVSLNKIDVNQIIQPKEIKRKGSKIVVKNTSVNILLSCDIFTSTPMKI